MSAGQIAIRFGLHGMCSCVVTACAGGNNAIGDAFRHVRDGYADVMVCGGSESCISELGVGGFASLKALNTTDDVTRASIPFDKERDGFVIAEGAGILVIEELEHALARGAKIYAEIGGYGANCDAYHVTAPDPEGNGGADCMKLAIMDADMKPEDIDYVNAHGTSTHMNDSCETKAIKKAFGTWADKLMVSSTKSMTGHMLGGAGAVEAISVCLPLSRWRQPASGDGTGPSSPDQSWASSRKGRATCTLLVSFPCIPNGITPAGYATRPPRVSTENRNASCSDGYRNLNQVIGRNLRSVV